MKAIYLRRTFGKVDVEHFSFSISWMFWLAGWSKVDLLSAWKQMRLGALPCWYFLDRKKSAFFSFSPDLQHHTVLANRKDIATGAVVMRDWYCRTTRGFSASLILDHTSSPYSTWSKIFSYTLAMIVKKVVVDPCVKLVCERYVSIYIYGNIQIENAPPVQLPKLKSNYRMNEWQFQNLSSMFKRHSSIFSDASWKLDCGFKGRERYTIWQSLELAQIPGTFCLSKLEPPCEQT